MLIPQERNCMEKQQNYVTNSDLNTALEANKKDLVSVISRSQAELAVMMAKGFEGMDIRFEAVDKRFEAVDKRFDGMDKRFDTIETRLDTVEMKIDRALYTDNVNLDRRVKKLENKV